MNTVLTFHRSGTGPAGRRAGQVPSLPMRAIHPPRQPAIPDEGRSQKNMPPATVHLECHADRLEKWSEAMTTRTTEPAQQKYPEAKITATDIPDRRAA